MIYFFSCLNVSSILKDNITVKDIDGNIYHTVKIGGQLWMAENLKVTRYCNGDPIPYVSDIAVWTTLTTGAYCNYDNNEINADTYGHLYNWYAVNDSRNIAPKGWHVPSDAEWKILVDYLGGSEVAGGKIKETGRTHWVGNASATNESGFSALPGGLRTHMDYVIMALYADFWSSTEYSFNAAMSWGLERNRSDIDHGPLYKDSGLSVRLVMD